jgi:glycosyltransferase involved in cell wall biosynthesis
VIALVETTVADDSYLSEFHKPTHQTRGEPLRVLFMSRLIATKGARTAIDSFGLASERLAQGSLELIVAGDGPEAENLQTYVATKRLQRIRMIGAVQGNARKELLLNSDVLIFPTIHDEGMPNVVLEALLYGMPVLSRRVGSIPQVVEHGSRGFLTESTDPAIFADWIVRLVSEPQLYRSMVIASHQHSLRFYTAPRVRARFMGILAELSELAGGEPSQPGRRLPAPSVRISSGDCGT